MDLEMRSSWIIQLGPNSNAKCPCKTHTGDRHTGRRRVKTKTETGMMWPQATSLCGWRIIFYSKWKPSELRHQENQGGRHMTAPYTWQQIKNENNNVDHLVTNKFKVPGGMLPWHGMFSFSRFQLGFSGHPQWERDGKWEPIFSHSFHKYFILSIRHWDHSQV